MSPRDRSLDDLVAAVTPRVVEEALEQAVEQARDELATRLARGIVDRALASGAAAAPPPAPARTPEPADTAPTATPPTPAAAPRSGQHADTALYAFAIIPARPVDLAGVAGIDGHAPLRIVQHGELGLVVSEMPMDLMDDVSEDDLSETGPLARLARRHDDVVRSVFETGPVLPLRFGTVVADEDGARRLLEEQSRAARQRLTHLDTHREWGVRLSRDPAAVDQDTGGSTDDRRGMTGTSYLASRRQALEQAQQAEQQTAALSARVEEALGEQAVDIAYRGGGPGSGVLADLAYLVPVAGQDAFLAAAERLNGEVAHEGLVLEVTGPWPPYSFATLESDRFEGGARTGVVGSA
ncbi:MAG TPA: GvpL/GvpF family gas vesicle protein [Nocardioidaceae bacterium]|nr:GvpL/GvpF family gas vesicle protein [Nocardioidaceae bacterium]